MSSKSSSNRNFPFGIRSLVGMVALTVLLMVIGVGAGLMERGFRNGDPSQPEDQPPDVRAEVALNQGDWVAAGAAMREMLDADPFDAKSMYYLACSLKKQELFDESIYWFEKASDFFKYRPASFFQLACVYASTGNSKSGIKSLRKALSLGFKTRRGIENFDELQPLRSEKEFADLAQQERSNRKSYRR